MEHGEVISTANADGGSSNSADEEKAGIVTNNRNTPRLSRPGSSSSGKHHHHAHKPRLRPIVGAISLLFIRHVPQVCT